MRSHHVKPHLIRLTHRTTAPAAESRKEETVTLMLSQAKLVKFMQGAACHLSEKLPICQTEVEHQTSASH
tara:strand:+ start:536 stop:745 length:210 start_codon:yes stop_codon:yes gene_type:complete